MLKSRIWKLNVLAVGLAFMAPMIVRAQSDNEKSDAEKAIERVSYDVKFLSSDELKGRGVGTDGIETAAKYVIDEYKKIGLKGGLPDGSYRQPFEVNLGRVLVKDSVTATFTGPQGKKLVLETGKTCQPMTVGGDADLSSGLVFVGYGIKADEHNYDDFKNVDVKDKVVVLIRIEPQQQKEDSVFKGKEPSDYARISNKIAAIEAAGAKGIVMVNDGVTAPTPDKDLLLASDELGRSGKLPFLQIQRAKLDEILAISPIPNPSGGNFDSLAKIEAFIDEKLEPVSAPLGDWTADFKWKFDSVKAKTDNIVGLIEGEGPLSGEYVVVGGHYDHLGMGEVGSRAGRRAIHNGADDNATGTAAVLELARRFAKYDSKPKRTMVFICFSGEERGLLGSSFYVNEEKPLFDLAKTIAMINFDMIGWLREGKLTVFGSSCGSSFDAILDQATKDSKVVLNRVPSPFAGSDHMPFYQKNVPVMFLHTGLTDTYHTPEDDYETLNMSGAVQVIDFSEKLIWELVNREDKPEFVASEGGGQARPSFLGVRFDFANTQDGLKVQSVSPDSPAQQAGLQEGDVVQELAGAKITERSELLKILRDNKPGSKIAIKFKRGEEEKSIDVELGKPAAAR